MALLLNNLGSYATIEAVWSQHPEGGREGDYVTVGGSVYYWDKYSRCWVQSGIAPTPSGGSQVVSGDLSVTGNLGVGGNAVINGTLTVNGVPITGGGGSGGSGQIVYKSIVFKRYASKPATPSPTDGAFGNPVPNGWSDGVPGGTDPIWMSSRIFTSDGAAPQQDYWSSPALMSDTEDMDVEFSNAPTTSVPSAPTTENAGVLWFDPVTHPNAPWSEMNWMATRTKYLDNNGNAVWSSWKIILIKGEQGEAGSDGAKGDGYQSIYTIAATTPATPTGEHPRGWYSSVSELTLTTGTALWMSERRCTSGVWGNWSTPVRISGFNGIDGTAGEAGADGSDIEFIYKRSNNLPTQDDTAPESVDTDDDVPEGWSDNPSGVDSSHKYEWMCQRTKPAGIDQSWGPWVGPFVWSAYGDKGMDGDGVEYIYRNDLGDAQAAIANPSYTYTTPHPTNPNAQAQHTIDNYRGGVYSNNDVWYPEGWDDHDGTWSFIGWNGGMYVNGEWIPQGWHDDPQGVSASNKEEYVSTRKRHDGQWGNWSAPALWATYSADHIVSIDSEGYWCVDGQRILVDGQPVKAEGSDGTGVAIKGSVDYLTSAQATTNVEQITNPTSLQGLSLTGLNAGDCYVVEFVKYESNAWTIKGHIYVYNGGTSSTYTDNWKDLGQFRGEAGANSYMHLAWATNVVISGASVTVTGFSLVNNTGDYDWMGILVDNYPNDSTTPTDYEWNYIKGVDGASQEYVYIRTKQNLNPGITTSYTDSNNHTNADAEFLPCANGDYTGEAEVKSGMNRAEYTDDPKSVDGTYKYCWMSTRKTLADGTWGDWSTPALWAMFSESQPWIDTAGLEQVVVDCDGESRPKSAVTVAITAKLMYGSYQCSFATSGCSVTEDVAGSVTKNYTPQQGAQKTSVEVVYSISGQGTMPILNTGAITITLTGTDQNGDTRTATKVIPVVPNRDGAAGSAGPSLRFRGAWTAQDQYVFDSDIRDCVKHDGSFWLLTNTTSGAYTSAPSGSNSEWTSMGNAGVVATELLLAENGAINLLSSNVINLFNGTVRTASINADYKGSYCIYYESGNKRMEFCYDGWIYYYNDDENNTIAWKLGHGGQIILNTVESWDIIRLHYFGSTPTSVPTPSSSASWDAPTVYYQYTSNTDTTNSGKIYRLHSSGQTPAQSTVAYNGYYTPDAGVRNMNNGDDTPVYVFTVYHIMNGKIETRKEWSSGGSLS